jgi:hypothetical protein
MAKSLEAPHGGQPEPVTTSWCITPDPGLSLRYERAHAAAFFQDRGRQVDPYPQPLMSAVRS